MPVLTNVGIGNEENKKEIIQTTLIHIQTVSVQKAHILFSSHVRIKKLILHIYC